MKTYRPVLDKRTRRVPAPHGATWFFLPLTREEGEHVATKSKGSKWAVVTLTWGGPRDEHWHFASVRQEGERIATLWKREFAALREAGRLLTEEEFEERQPRAAALHRAAEEGANDYYDAEQVIGRPIRSFIQMDAREMDAYEAWLRRQPGSMLDPEPYGGTREKDAWEHFLDECSAAGVKRPDAYAARALGLSRVTAVSELSSSQIGDARTQLRHDVRRGHFGSDRAPGQPMRGTRSRVA